MIDTSNTSSYIEKVIMNLPAFLEKYPGIESIITTLLPYIPALKQLAEEEVEKVIDLMLTNKWNRVDEKLVKLMTHEQKLALLDETHKDALAAAEAEYRHNQLAFELGLKLALALLLALL